MDREFSASNKQPGISQEKRNMMLEHSQMWRELILATGVPEFLHHELIGAVEEFEENNRHMTYKGKIENLLYSWAGSLRMHNQKIFELDNERKRNKLYDEAITVKLTEEDERILNLYEQLREDARKLEEDLRN